MIGDLATHGHPAEPPGASGASESEDPTPHRGSPVAVTAGEPRLTPPMPSSGLVGWIGPLLVTAVGAFFRFFRLDQPHAVVFDETYYAKDAWAILHTGYAHKWPEKANDAILAGGATFQPEAEYTVHPEVGKWVIGAGEWLFGMNPYGWRFAVAVLGTLSILMLARIARRLTRSDVLGTVAGLLLALDGLHLVMSRTALLDLVLMFFVLGAFGCLLLDRDSSRARLALVAAGQPYRLTGGGPGLGARPWRWAAAALLGLACATKWSGAWYLVAFVLLTVAWDVGARRLAGVERPYRRLFGSLAGVGSSFGAISLGVYLASWTGWLASSGAYYRDWSAKNPGGGWQAWVPDGLRSLGHYHSEMLRFHTELNNPHPYQSKPWGWPVLARPISYFYEQVDHGVAGCPADRCAREVLGMGTPLLWWLGTLALVVLVWRWAVNRDWRAGAVLLAVAAGWLPWFAYSQRTIFYFYAVVFAPFLVLAVVLLLGLVLGPDRASPGRRAVGALSAGLLVLLIVVCFAFFHPLYTAEPLPIDDWSARMWFRDWI